MLDGLLRLDELLSTNRELFVEFVELIGELALFVAALICAYGV